MKTSIMARNRGQVYSVGNYLMNGKVLGKGNFARVEEATHRIIGKKVAIKIIDLTCIKEEYARRHLHREPKVMARLRHPCIAALYETMMHGPRLFMVMEAAGGGNLCAHVLTARTGSTLGLPEVRARALSTQLVSAVRHMHARGVVHRDLKMENIMLDSTKQFIKIVDFGLSNVWSSAGGLRTPCGSLEYAAPELFLDGRRYGPEVDLWSIGVIVYGMVTGALPFGGGGAGEGGAGRTRPQLRAAIARGFSRKHRAELAALSPECKVFVQQLLEPSVETRMKIEEAARHRWLRKPGLRMKTHPLPDIDLKTKRAISRQISELSGQSLTDVVAEIKADPYGSVGGMYNIKTHTSQLQCAGADLLWTSSPDTLPRPASPPIYHPHPTTTVSNNSTILCRQSSPNNTDYNPLNRPQSTNPPAVYKQTSTMYKPSEPALKTPLQTPPVNVYKTNLNYKQNTTNPPVYRSTSQPPTCPTVYKTSLQTLSTNSAEYKPSSVSSIQPQPYNISAANYKQNSPAPPVNYKPIPPSTLYNGHSSLCRTASKTRGQVRALVRKPLYRVNDNGDCVEPRLPSIDEHGKEERGKGRCFEDDRLRLNSCPERTERRTDFYRRGGDGLPSWRATGVAAAGSARIQLQSNATTIKRASLGNIVSPHSSSNSHCKSERAGPVGWYSTRGTGKEPTPLRLRRTAPIK